MFQHPNSWLTPRGRQRLDDRSRAGESVSALSPFIDRYNWTRPHSACGGLPPMSRIVGVNNVMAHNS